MALVTRSEEPRAHMVRGWKSQEPRAHLVLVRRSKPKGRAESSYGTRSEEPRAKESGSAFGTCEKVRT